MLSSTNRLKPEYDREFDVYRTSNMPEYQYSDEKTKNDIVLVQKEFWDGKIQNKRINKRETYNSVVRGIYLFLLLLIIAAIVLFVPFKEHSDRFSDDYRESLWNELFSGDIFSSDD